LEIDTLYITVHQEGSPQPNTFGSGAS